MKATSAVIMFAVIAFAAALPARNSMLYLNGPQRLMYVQSVQPAQPFARSTQAAEVLVAGDSVATGTYLKESDVAAAGPSIDAAGAENIEVAASVDALEVEDAAATAADEVNNVEEDVLAVGEAVPEEPKVDVDDAAKEPRELNFDAVVPTSAPAVRDAADAAAEEPVFVADVEPAVETGAVDVGVAAVGPAAKRYSPKKVFVELEQPAAANIDEDDDSAVVDDDDDDNDEDEDVEAEEPVKPARRPAKQPVVKATPAAKATPTKTALPAGTFFPVNFGGTKGGAIAVANSFSTGEGGSATSHAIAYGSPDAARAARLRPSKKH